jgi:pyruvate,orthophosphate dikinase
MEIVFFGNGISEAPNPDKFHLGGKGANLCRMAALGIPVPPGIVLPTSLCREYMERGDLPPELMPAVQEKLKKVEEATGRYFANPHKPLLVSVRSGAPVSMPGMMDTILNLGLNADTVKGMVLETGDERFVLDSYRRFIQMFGDVVLGIPHASFEEILDHHKKRSDAVQDTDLSPSTLRDIVEDYRNLVRKATGQGFPDDPHMQLRMAIEAVFRSWNNERAIYYRRLNHIPDSYGTAVNIQSMVFGNMGNTSGTGVCFTRNPSTGEKKFYGEFLINAQGEDVVAGIRTPQKIEELEALMPEVYRELLRIQSLLESHYRDMQDIEFTVQQGKLYLLQTRNGKRTSAAALKIACDMVDENLIDSRTALLRIEAETLPALLAPVFDPAEVNAARKEKRVLAKGLNAGPGAASGYAVFHSARAVEMAAQGKTPLLVRMETSPDDIKGMQHSSGILTARGGMTSHAAVVARGMNKPCVVGCSSLIVYEDQGYADIVTEEGKHVRIKEGDAISIDGTTGEVFAGHMQTVDSDIQRAMRKEIDPESSWMARDFFRIMKWSDEVRRLRVRANADTPEDARVARLYGAEGIGLCRTEHMFFGPERLPFMQQMILARTREEREIALKKLLPFQREDFERLFEVMEGNPVTIRLLDPPLHEFLPHTDEQIAELSRKIGVSEEYIRERASALKELNPMLGHRGCRLGITYPEITRMQVRAILEAACKCQKRNIQVHPEIMIPLVGHRKELSLQKEVIEEEARRLLAEFDCHVDYQIGTMIEVPRAALTADQIAIDASFFSFGTNDLTQMTLGFSRDDSEPFLREYLREGIYDRNPFATVDENGVGQLIRIALQKGKSARQDLKTGVCGEQGGDPTSIQFFHKAGLDYVSCSPYRVPVARLAAAQAVLAAQ